MSAAAGASGRPIRVLYIVYWGAAEPLGRSLVVPAVCRLAELGVDLTLVTFEKPADLAQTEEIRRLRQRLADHGVRWRPLLYHQRPKWPATAFDMLQGTTCGLWARRSGPFDVVHARTFVGGPMGFAAARALGARFVYHNEGFYPDEQVDGGVWRAGSFAHRLAKGIERRLYGSADGIIVLSQRAKQQVEELDVVRRRRTPVLVVPSAVDLERFRPRAPLTAEPRGELRFLYSGSVGLRYLLDRVGRFVTLVSQGAKVSLRVLSGAPPELIESLLDRGGLARELWSSDRVPHERMPEELARAHAGLFFLTQGLSEQGCSPTKFGEYWAAGLPVVTTANVSDSEQVIRSERVGVIVREHTDAAYRLAAAELLELLEDPELPQRCRRAAESHYSLEQACRNQVDFYRSITTAR